MDETIDRHAIPHTKCGHREAKVLFAEIDFDADEWVDVTYIWCPVCDSRD